MSFCQDAKKEIAAVSESACCRDAKLCAALWLGTKQEKDRITLRTESAALSSFIEQAVKDRFAITPTLRVTKTAKGHFYNLDIPSPAPIYAAYGIGPLGRPNLELLRKDCCRQAFLRGAFLGAGRIADPSKSYQMEFILRTASAAYQLSLFLAELGYPAAMTDRGNRFLCYYRDSDSIEDLLSLMGATNCAFSLMNTKIEKDVRSSINRRGNCDAANADKQVEAAHAQLADIKALISIGAFNRLPQEVRECAQLRLDNPEFSLTEIGEQCDPPVSKSAVARRLKKLKDYIK